jgi:hypothetical protein
MSESEQITYRDLAELLEELGFRDESVQGSHRAFRHAASDSLILFALAAPADPVRKEDFISVRRHLDSKGLMATAAFDQRFPRPSPGKSRPSA